MFSKIIRYILDTLSLVVDITLHSMGCIGVLYIDIGYRISYSQPTVLPKFNSWSRLFTTLRLYIRGSNYPYMRSIESSLNPANVTRLDVEGS